MRPVLSGELGCPAVVDAFFSLFHGQAFETVGTGSNQHGATWTIMLHSKGEQTAWEFLKLAGHDLKNCQEKFMSSEYFGKALGLLFWMPKEEATGTGKIHKALD